MPRAPCCSTFIAGSGTTTSSRCSTFPRALLPEVCDTAGDFGVTDAALFGRVIPITAMVGDQQGALVGQACFAPGMMKSTYGTGCFVLVNTGATALTSRNRLLTTIAYRLNGVTTYALEGSIFNAGTVVQWMRDGAKLIATAAESEAMAAGLDAHGGSGGVYFVPAFTGLGAPHWDPDARGAILGLTRDSTRAHIVRAGLESVCYQTADLISALRQDGIAEPGALRVDGGMAANRWLLQFLADITNLPVERPVYGETTVLGAAFLAGLGAGLFTSLDDIKAAWSLDFRAVPRMPARARAELLAGWQEAVARVTLARPNAASSRFRAAGARQNDRVRCGITSYRARAERRTEHSGRLLQNKTWCQFRGLGWGLRQGVQVEMQSPSLAGAAKAGVTAKVKWFNPAKGFGFVAPMDGTTVRLTPSCMCPWCSARVYGLCAKAPPSSAILPTDPEVRRSRSSSGSTIPPLPMTCRRATERKACWTARSNFSRSKRATASACRWAAAPMFSSASARCSDPTSIAWNPASRCACMCAREKKVRWPCASKFSARPRARNATTAALTIHAWTSAFRGLARLRSAPCFTRVRMRASRLTGF